MPEVLALLGMAFVFALYGLYRYNTADANNYNELAEQVSKLSSTVDQMKKDQVERAELIVVDSRLRDLQGGLLHLREELSKKSPVIRIRKSTEVKIRDGKSK